MLPSLSNYTTGSPGRLKKAKIDDVINDIDFLNISGNLACVFTPKLIRVYSKRRAQVGGSQKEGRFLKGKIH